MSPIEQQQIEATNAQAQPTYSAFTVYSGDVKEKVSNAPIGPLTRVVGEEGSYKSAFTIGVRLALTGEYEPIGKLPSELIKLAADRTTGIRTFLEGPSGSFEWTLKVDPETGKPKRPGPPNVEGALLRALSEEERARIIPTDSVRELLKSARGDRKRRESLLRRFGGSLKDIPEPFALNDEERAVWAAAIETCRRALDEGASADTLLANLSEHFRKRSGDKRREITPIENDLLLKRKHLQTIGSGSEMLPELQEQLARAQKWEAAQGAMQWKASLLTEQAQLQAEIEACEAAARQRQAEYESKKTDFTLAFEAARDILQQRHAELLDIISLRGSADVNAKAFARAASNGVTICLYCKADHVDGVKRFENIAQQFEARLQEREKLVEQAEQGYQRADASLDEARRRVAEVETSHLRAEAGAEARHATLRTKYAQVAASLREVEKKLAGVPTSYRGKTADELSVQVNALSSIARARADLEREGQRVRTLEREYAVFKVLEEQSTQMQKDIMGRVSQTASREVTLGMSGGRTAILDAETCEWTVVGADGEPHAFGAMCGTEKTSLMLGLAAAWTRGNPLRVAIFDDEDMVGLSTKGLQDFYLACEDAYTRGDFTQVFIVSNRPEVTGSTGCWHTIMRGRQATDPSEVVLS